MILLAGEEPPQPLLTHVGFDGNGKAALARRGDPAHVGGRVAPDLHLHAWDPRLDPPAQLTAQPRGIVRREPAAAVDRHALARHAQQLGHRPVEELPPQVPERDVDRRDRHRRDPVTAEVANLGTHRGPDRGVLERVAADDDVVQRIPNQQRGRRIGVRVTDAGSIRRLELHQHQGRCVPHERAVGFWAALGRDAVRAHREIANRSADA